MNVKRKGTVSPTRAARILGVHVNSVHRWCQQAVDGEPSKLHDVTRNNANGYYQISREDIERIKNNVPVD